MDCPNCGVYNPESRKTCWRCDAMLPTQAPPKRRARPKMARLWLYISMAIFALITILRMCSPLVPLESPDAKAPTGQVAPPLPQAPNPE